MRPQNFISGFLCLILILTTISCKTLPSSTFSIKSLDTTIKATKISISDLAKNYKLYQGQYIETTGRFCEAFEEFAVYTNNNILTGEAEGFWLGTDRQLKIDNALFDKMNGKPVTIKGKIDTTRKGHLASYLATIDSIYFWQH
jgi:hypothetical protein